MMNLCQKNRQLPGRNEITKVLILWMIGSVQSAINQTKPNSHIETSNRLTEERKVEVECESNQMCVNLPKEFREDLNLKLSDCFNIEENGRFCANLDSCGTDFNVVNDTHVIYSNQILYGEAESEISWNCLYPVETMAHLDLSSKRSKMKEIIAPAGFGQFFVSFQLFQDSTYYHPYASYPKLSKDGTIRGRVTLHNHQSLERATVQLQRCWATPTIVENGGFDLVNNYCPIKSGANVKILNSGTDHFATFESGVFKFTDSKVVYLHCHIKICFKQARAPNSCVIDPKECDDRRKRSLLENTTPDTIISIGPIDVASANVIGDLESLGQFEKMIEEKIIEELEDGKIRIDPAVLWSLLIALMLAAVGLGAILVYWLRQDAAKEASNLDIDTTSRGTVSTFDPTS